MKLTKIRAVSLLLSNSNYRFVASNKIPKSKKWFMKWIELHKSKNAYDTYTLSFENDIELNLPNYVILTIGKYSSKLELIDAYYLSHLFGKF